MILSEKQRMLQKFFRGFAEKEFTPDLLDRLEKTGDFDWGIFKKMAAAGLTGNKIPVKYGGQGGDYMSYVLMMEEFARVSAVLSIYANTSNSLGGGPLLFCANEEQKQKYLTPVARGEKIIVFGLSEAEAGSDAGGMQTTALPDPDDPDFYILNGRKTFISGAPVADYCVIYAKTDLSQKGSKGISMFIMDMKLPGVSVGKNEDKMGIKGYPTSDVIMDNVRVSKDDILGPLHKGFATAMKTLNGGRLGTAAQALGIAQHALEESIKFSKERRQFGKPICKNQGISFMLADMATEIECARQLIYHGAELLNNDSPEAPKICSMAKYYASEMSNRVCYKAVQIHGGCGYTTDYPVERLYRDARITTIYEGTSQVQQIVISGSILR